MAKHQFGFGPSLAISTSVQRVVNENQSARIAMTAAMIAAVGVATLLDARITADEGEESDSLIQRVVAQATRSAVGIRATRELRAGTLSGKHQGWMLVETTVSSTGAFSWKVMEEGGSERTREKVFYDLLKTEADGWRTGSHGSAALTHDNYQFSPLPTTRAGQTQIRLTPRRADTKLIDGILTVAADGSPLRLEGKLAKTPSFWVKSVTVVKHYNRFAGVALPTSIESLADLKMFGRATFTMRYRYSEVNGKTVTHAVAAAPFVGPTAEILALHGSGPEQ